MAYQLSNEIKQQIQKDAEKLKNRNGQQKTSGNTSGGFANNTTAQNGNNAGRGLTNPPANNYQLSDEIKSQIQKDAEKLRSRSKNYNIGAVALDDATGKGTQPTTGYYNEYGIYTIPDPNAPQQQSYAPAAPTRTRADIEKEIAQREQELNLVYGEVDAAQGDSWKMTDIKNRAKAIRGELEKLNTELWMVEQSEIYNAIPGYSDFAKNSAVTGKGKDTNYLYINDVDGARGMMAGQALRSGGYGDVFQYAYMTPEQIGIYNYLYNVSGKKAANKYLEYLDFSLYDQQNQAIYDATFEQAQKNVGTKVAASVASIPMNLSSGVGYLDVLGQKVAKNVTGSDKPINYNRGAQTGYTFTQGAREGTMEDMSDTGRFIYSTAMSMGDSLAVLGISLATGGTAASALLGGSAATSTMHEAKKNGASDEQALAMGFVSGAAETIMEKLPLEELLNLTSASGVKAIVGQIVKQGANEATEEVLTTLVNTAADALIMGDKQELLRKYEEYIANGYSPEEAERLAKADWWKGLATDAVGGFVSGLTFGAGGTIIQNSRANADRRETGKSISTSSYTLPVLIEHVESGYTDANTGETVQYSEETKKTAQQIKTDLAAGKNISNVRKGKLAEQILKDNASFEADVLPSVMAEVQKREDAASSEQNTEKAGEEKPERNVIDRIKERLQEKTEAKSGEKTVSPAAAKMLAEEVVDGDNYTEETKAVAQRIIDSEQVSEADSSALINGIKAENVDFSGYSAEEIIAEASVLAQEEAPQSTATETTAETKTAAPKSTAQQTTTKGAVTNEQRTDSTGNEQQSTEDGTTRADRGRGRFSETYSGDAAPVSAQNRDVRAAKSRAQTASERQNKVADLRIEPTSAASLGINGGSEDATMYIIPEKAYDEELKSVAADAKANGVTVHFFTGVMPVNNSYANASVSGNEMYVRADSAKYTAAELYDHEKFHKIFRGKPGLITELYNWIRNNYTAESFDDIIDTYYDKYNDVYNLDEMSADDAIRIILEEIFADAYAGTNKFAAGATEYTAPVRAAADAMGATPSEYNANQGRAPPQGMTYDSIKQAVREVLGETGAQNQLQGVEQISDAKNQQGLDMRQEVMFSISKDSLYMDNAIKMNESKKNVDAEDMNEAKALRAKVAARMIEIKDRGLVGLPEDKEGNTFISNSSYGGTEENTTVCPRSLAAEAFVDAVSEYLGRPLTIQEQIYISQDLQGRSLTPECTCCYVATDRKAYRAFLGEYIAQRDAVVEKLRENPDIDVTTLRADHQKLKNDANATVSPIGQIYKEFLNGRKVTDSMYDRFKMWVDTYKSGAPMVEASHLANIDKLMGDIRSEFGAELKPQIADAMKYAQSASWAKKRVSYVAYNGHILKWKQDRINKLNSHYGLRMYSFSDFHPAFVLENMQMLTDAAVRGLKVLGYTKDTDFVEIFAPTGMNINISTFGGIMDGVVFENDRIGASWAKAQELRNKYPNVGITFVATNDAMVEWALKQDWIDVVIPYHLVRTGTEIAKAFGYTNYTAESADTKRSDWEKGFEKSISPTEHNNDKETYLKALEKNRLEPRFKRYLDNDNYMKLVNECRQPASLSEPVKPVFNEDAAMKALAKLEANGYYQPIGGSVDRMYEIAAEIGEELNSRPQQMFSISDEVDGSNGFYSHMARVVDGVKQEKLGASSVVNMLRGKGVKAEEIKWSGIEQFLEGKKSVTKAELQEFVAGSMLQIKETTIDSLEEPMSAKDKKRITALQEERNALVQKTKSEWRRIFGTSVLDDYVGEALPYDFITKLAEAVVAKKSATSIGQEYRAAQQAAKEMVEESYDYYGFDDARQAYVSMLRDPDGFLRGFELSASEESVVRRLSDAKARWLELDDAVPAEDVQTLKDLSGDIDSLNAEITDIRIKHSSEQKRPRWGSYKLKGGENYREIVFRMPNSDYVNDAMETHWRQFEFRGVLAHARLQDFDTPNGRMLFIEEIQSDWHNAGHKQGYAEKPSKVITTGNTTVKLENGRYELYYQNNPLGESVSASFLARRFPNGISDAEIHEGLVENYSQHAEYDSRVPDAPFRDSYHEFVLKKLIRKAAESGYDSIGWTTAQIQSDRWSEEYAEGYRIEYDQDIPKFLNKYGKKWGAKVEKSTLPNGTEIWSMDITDSMRESVMTEGQPLYSLSDEYDVAPEDRTWADTGDRKFNSYAFDHPELRPYFKEAARSMFYDLLNSVKGERWSTTSDAKNWTGSKRNTTENIARLLDNGHMTYKRIQEALLTMLYKVEDGKAMNRADVKKVELELDAMLQEGYTDPTGLEVEPNREYRRLLDAIKSGYGSVEEADAAYEAEVRDEAYEAQIEADVWEGYDQRADEMYDEVYSAYEPDVEAYEDISQEDRDYLGEIVESADELRLQRMADEKLRAAEELDEENEALRLRNMEYAEEANNYFDAYNYEELENERRRMDAVMQNALQNPDISAAPDTSAEHWESISAQLIEEKRRQKRENAVAEAENNDMYLPDGVSDAEILAAQEKYREQTAARKAADEAKYEGMTAEETEAAKEADARRAQAEYLEGVDRKNFIGSDAMEKLKIKISRSIANYKSSAGLIERAKANAALVREMDKAIRKMHPSEEEKYFATGIMNNDLSEYSIPMHLDAERVLELADYMVARKAGRTDLFAAQKADINNRNRQLASDKFKNAEKAKRVSLTRLNYMTPRRAMIEMFGQEQGEEIYRTFFAPVRTNDAERIRFAERLRQEALEIVGADGKKGKLTKEERALTQMLMEGKAAGEMLAKMETGGKERIEAAAKRILKGEPLREENGKYVVGEEGADELSAKEAEIARRHAAYTQAQEAIRTGAFDKKKVDGKRITNAAKHFAQQYDMLYEAINEFLVAHGEQPIGFIKGYAPHLQAEDAMKPLERLLEWMGAPTDITDLRAEIAGETHNRKPNRKWNPHFLSRTVGSETEYDVYKGFEEYVDYISEVFYHMDDIMRLRAASRYLRTAYTTEDSKNQLKQIEEVRNGGYYEKMNFLLANNRIARGETLIGAEIDEALDKYIDEILNEEENKTAVSSSLVMWLDNYTNLLAGKQNAMDRGLEQQIGRKGIRAVNKAVNRLISAQVVGNISSALNQMAQMPMTLTELGADNVSKALWDLVRHSGEMRRWSTENDFLAARKGTTILNYQITGKLTNGLAKPLELADWLMSSITARAAYHQALKQGMDVESAMDYSVQKAEDIMGSRNKASKPVAFNTKNPIMRLVNAYQIEVLNQWQHIIKDLPREYKSIAQSRGGWAAFGRIAKDLVLYLILAALINRIAEETYGGTPAPLDLLGIVGNFAASGNGLTLNEGIVRVINSMTGKMFGKEWLKENHTFDSEMPDEFDWGAAWEDTAYTLSSEIPFLNNIMAVAGLTDDETVFAAGINDAKESFFGKKGEGGAIDHFFVTRREREEGEQESAEVLDGLYDVAMGISEFILGGRQLQKTIQGVVTLSGGGEKNRGGNLMYPVEDTVGNWIKGTLFGKTALENSRAYYASGAAALSGKRNEQYYFMVENGVNEETAYGVAQGFADVGDKFRDQMEYIMNTDLPDEIKNGLAFSVASEAAYNRYVSYDLESEGIEPAEFMFAWAFYNSATGKDTAGQTEEFLRQQGVSAGDIAKIIAALKKK